MGGVIALSTAATCPFTFTAVVCVDSNVQEEKKKEGNGTNARNFGWIRWMLEIGIIFGAAGVVLALENGIATKCVEI